MRGIYAAGEVRVQCGSAIYAAVREYCGGGGKILGAAEMSVPRGSGAQ